MIRVNYSQVPPGIVRVLVLSSKPTMFWFYPVIGTVMIRRSEVECGLESLEMKCRIVAIGGASHRSNSDIEARDNDYSKGVRSRGTVSKGVVRV